MLAADADRAGAGRFERRPLPLLPGVMTTVVRSDRRRSTVASSSPSRPIRRSGPGRRADRSGLAGRAGRRPSDRGRPRSARATPSRPSARPRPSTSVAIGISPCDPPRAGCLRERRRRRGGSGGNLKRGGSLNLTAGNGRGSRVRQEFGTRWPARAVDPGSAEGESGGEGERARGWRGRGRARRSGGRGRRRSRAAGSSQRPGKTRSGTGRRRRGQVGVAAVARGRTSGPRRGRGRRRRIRGRRRARSRPSSAPRSMSSGRPGDLDDQLGRADDVAADDPGMAAELLGDVGGAQSGWSSAESPSMTVALSRHAEARGVVGDSGRASRRDVAVALAVLVAQGRRHVDDSVRSARPGCRAASPRSARGRWAGRAAGRRPAGGGCVGDRSGRCSSGASRGGGADGRRRGRRPRRRRGPRPDRRLGRMWRAASGAFLLAVGGVGLGRPSASAAAALDLERTSRRQGPELSKRLISLRTTSGGDDVAALLGGRRAART